MRCVENDDHEWHQVPPAVQELLINRWIVQSGYALFAMVEHAVRIVGRIVQQTKTRLKRGAHQPARQVAPKSYLR